MKNDTQPFDAMTRLEESICKSRGLAYLMSRALQTIGNSCEPNELDVSGIQHLTNSVSDEVLQRFDEAFRSVVKPAAEQSTEILKPAA